MAELTAHDDDTHTRVALAGRLDLPGVQALELQFTANTAAAKKPAVVDMSGVVFIASLGLRMLLSSAKALRAAGARMVILNPPEPVAEVLRTAGIDQVITVTNDEQMALAIALSVV
jgi:anti-sigma B factor antagonist